MKNIHEIVINIIRGISVILYIFFLVKSSFAAYQSRNSLNTTVKKIAGSYLITNAIVIIIASIAITFIYFNKLQDIKINKKLVFLFHFGHLAEFIFNILILKQILRERHHYNINILLCIYILIYGSAVIKIHQNETFYNETQIILSISSIILTIIMLSGSFYYIHNNATLISQENIFQNPLTYFVIGIFLSNCLSLLNNISILFYDFSNYINEILSKEIRGKFNNGMETSQFLRFLQTFIDFFKYIPFFIFLTKGFKLKN